MVRSDALRFETNRDRLDKLATKTKYGFSPDNVKKVEEIIKKMTIEEHMAITDKYIVPDKM